MTSTGQLRGATIQSKTVAVGVSLAILLAAVFVELRASEYESLGPLDLDTAEHLALGLWVTAPLVGGLAARRLSNRELARAAVALGVVVGLIAAFFVLSAASAVDDTCAIDLPAFPGAYPLGCLAFGALVGLGMSLAFWFSAAAARRWITVLPGAVLAGAATWAASAAAYELFYGAVRCLR